MFRSKLLDSRTQIVVQSDSLAAGLVAVKLPFPEVLSALAAEIALVLDELSAKLKVCEMLKPMQQTVARSVHSCITRQRHVSPCASKRCCIYKAWGK